MYPSGNLRQMHTSWVHPAPALPVPPRLMRAELGGAWMYRPATPLDSVLS